MIWSDITRYQDKADGRQLKNVSPDGQTGSGECSPMFTKETLFDVADHVWSSRYRISLWFL